MDLSRFHVAAATVICSAFLLVIVSGSLKARPAGYAGDLPYLNLLFAESISEYGVYGIKGDPKPAMHDAWWRRAGGVLTHHAQISPELSYRLLTAACSLLLILALVSRLHSWFPRLPAAAWVGGVLLATSPPAALWIINGSSTALAALLVCAAVCLHIRGLVDDQPLPFAAAMCLGLAVCLRVEFIAVWFALMIHGIFVAAGPKRADLSLVAVFVRGLSGLVVCAIFLAPLISWNMRLILVPWPRYFDAPLTLNMFSGSSSEAVAAVNSVVKTSIHQAFTMWSESNFVSGWLEKLFALAGVIYWMVRAEKDNRATFSALLAVLVLVPFFHALVVPFVGWTGGAVLYESLTPVWILGVVSGIAGIHHLLDPLLMRVLPAFSNYARHTVVIVLIALTPVLDGIFKNQHMIKLDKAETLAAGQVAESVKNAIFPEGITYQAVASDQPGRIVYEWAIQAVDLTAELDPELFAYLDDQAGFAGYLKENNVHAVVISNQRIADWVRNALPVSPLYESADQATAFPFVGRL